MRRTRAAIMVDEVAEGARTYILGTDEAQPIEPLLLAQFYALAQRRPPAGYRPRIAQHAARHNPI